METIIGKDGAERKVYSNKEITTIKKQASNFKSKYMKTKFQSEFKSGKDVRFIVLNMSTSSFLKIKSVYTYNPSMKKWVELLSTEKDVTVSGKENNKIRIGNKDLRASDEYNEFVFNGRFEETGESRSKIVHDAKIGNKACIPLKSNDMSLSVARKTKVTKIEDIIGKDGQARRVYTSSDLEKFRKQSPSNRINNIPTRFKNQENRMMKILTMRDASGRGLRGLYIYNKSLKSWVEAFSTYSGFRVFGDEKNEFFVGRYSSVYKEQSNVFSFNGKFEESGEPCLEIGAKMKNGYETCIPLVSNNCVFTNRYNNTPKHVSQDRPVFINKEAVKENESVPVNS